MLCTVDLVPTHVRSATGYNEFNVSVALHQGSDLSPTCLSLLTMDSLTSVIKEQAARCMPFVNNGVLIGEEESEVFCGLGK